ncbi:MAG: hypothetical protein H5U08_07570, partial [Thermogutta sp.]|uniref:hypothetical protein n=1 Tax=Thermogutta sp. TaxID=1962930 RepID=UPI0019C102D5
MRSLRNSPSVVPVRHGGFVVIVAALWSGLYTPCFSQEIVLENQFVRYVVGPDGRNVSLTDKLGQGEQLITTQTGYIVTYHQAGKTFLPRRCIKNGDRLTAEFENGRVVLEVTSRLHHFTFRIASVEGNPEEIR